MVYQYGQALLCSLAIHGSVQPLIDMARAAYPTLNKKYQTAIAEVELNRKLAKEQVAELQAEILANAVTDWADMADFEVLFQEDQLVLAGVEGFN